MPSSRGRFATVDEIGERLERGAERVAITFLLELDKQLRRSPRQGGTPVKTGHARANWVPSIAQPFTGEAKDADQGAHDAGVGAVLSYRLGQGNLWIANNAPYIRRLNDGWSEQAGVGFIERAIDLALRVVEKRFGEGAIGISVADYERNINAEFAENIASAYSPFGDE